MENDLVVARTPDELSRIRSESLEELRELGHDVVSFTCDGCGAVPTCRYAFDGYCTGGDCLAEK